MLTAQAILCASWPDVYLSNLSFLCVQLLSDTAQKLVEAQEAEAGQRSASELLSAQLAAAAAQAMQRNQLVEDLQATVSELQAQTNLTRASAEEVTRVRTQMAARERELQEVRNSLQGERACTKSGNCQLPRWLDLTVTAAWILISIVHCFSIAVFCTRMGAYVLPLPVMSVASILATPSCHVYQRLISSLFLPLSHARVWPGSCQH